MINGYVRISELGSVPKIRCESSFKLALTAAEATSRAMQRDGMHVSLSLHNFVPSSSPISRFYYFPPVLGTDSI